MSSSSDSDYGSLDKQKYSNVLFNHSQRSTNANQPMTPLSKSKATSDVMSSGGSHIRKSNSRMQDDLGEPSTGAIDVFSSGEELPLLNRRKRKEAQNTIIVSSEEESDKGSDDSALNHTSPRRNGQGPKAAHRVSVPPQQSRPRISSRINSRSFLLGGSTGNAPVSSLRKIHIATPTKPKKYQSSSRQTRSSTKLKGASPSKNRESSSRMRQQPKSSPLPINLSSDDLTSDSGTELQSSVRRPTKKTANIASTDTSPLRESSLVTTPSSLRKRKDHQGSRKGNNMDSSDESDDIIVSPLKRKRLVRPSEQSPLTFIGTSRKQVAEDLEEDLEALQETGTCA